MTAVLTMAATVFLPAALCFMTIANACPERKVPVRIASKSQR